MSNKPKVKTLSVKDGKKLGIINCPSFHATGSITGMRKQYYGDGAFLVRCGSYIYNVSDRQDIYHAAH